MSCDEKSCTSESVNISSQRKEMAKVISYIISQAKTFKILMCTFQNVNIIRKKIKSQDD